MVRLWQLVASRRIHPPVPRFGDAVPRPASPWRSIVGMPLGVLLARVRILRVGIEPYIMIALCDANGGADPLHPVDDGVRLRAQGAGGFPVRGVPGLYNTVEGARSIKPEMIEVARSFRSSEWALWREVMLPYTLPYAMTGVRQAIGRALVGMIAAEFFLSSTGLGQLIMSASQNFDTGGVFASIFVIALIGVGLMRLGLEDRAPLRALEAVNDGRANPSVRGNRSRASTPRQRDPAVPRLICRAHHPAGVGIRRAGLRAGLCRQADDRGDGDPARDRRSGVSEQPPAAPGGGGRRPRHRARRSAPSSAC